MIVPFFAAAVTSVTPGGDSEKTVIYRRVTSADNFSTSPTPISATELPAAENRLGSSWSASFQGAAYVIRNPAIGEQLLFNSTSSEWRQIPMLCHMYAFRRTEYCYAVNTWSSSCPTARCASRIE